MKYPALPDRSKVPLYSAADMQYYAQAAVDLYEDSLDESILVATLKSDIKVKDSTIRTLQTELLRLKSRPIVTPVSEGELITLRRRVAELEERCRQYSWATDKTQWGA